MLSINSVAGRVAFWRGQRNNLHVQRRLLAQLNSWPRLLVSSKPFPHTKQLATASSTASDLSAQRIWPKIMNQ